MQFCMYLGDGQEALIRRIYDVLKEDTDILTPLGRCPYSPLMVTLIDRFGINWCIFL